MTDPSVVVYLNAVSWVGGAEGSLMDLIRNLDRSRFQPVVVCPTDGELPRMLRDSGIEVHIIPFYKLQVRNPLRFFETLLRVSSLIRRYRARLLHINHQYAANYGILAARISGVPAVVHLKGVETDEFFNEFFCWIYRADRVICVSKAVKSRLIEYAEQRLGEDKVDGLRLRTHVIYNGCSLDDLLSKANARAILGVPVDCKLVGIVGQVVPGKGIREFIEAAKLVSETRPDTQFVIIGEDTTPGRSFAEDMARYANELGIGQRVRFTGFRADAAQLMGAMDVSVLASWREAFARTVVESFGAGVPVVGTRVGGVPEILEDGVHGLLVPPKDARALADGILRILNMSPEDYRRMSENARRRAADFSIDKHVKKVQEVYDELL